MNGILSGLRHLSLLTGCCLNWPDNMMLMFRFFIFRLICCLSLEISSPFISFIHFDWHISSATLQRNLCFDKHWFSLFSFVSVVKRCQGVSGAVAACQCGVLSCWLLCVLYRTFQVWDMGHRPECSRTRFLCCQERLYRQQVCSCCLWAKCP